MSMLDRRLFPRALGVAAVTATVPTFLQKSGILLAGDERREISPLPGLKDNRVLVIVQLAGGNDGLNTVVPYTADPYFKARPKIAINRTKVCKLNDTLGLHPRANASKSTSHWQYETCVRCSWVDELP